MNNKYTKRLPEALLLLSIITACIVSVCVSKYLATDITSIQQDSIQEISHGWEYEDASGQKGTTDLPATLKLNPPSDSLTLSCQLPDDLPRNPSLEFFSRQTSVEVFVDGQSIYTYGVNNKAPELRLLGNSRNVIILPADAAGKELTIRLAAPYSPDVYNLSSVTLGSEAEILYRFMHSNIGLIVFSLLSVFFCLTILFIAAFFRIKKGEIDSFSIASFAFFVLLSTTWVVSDANIMQMFTSNFALIYFISHLAFMLFPVPLFLFLRQTMLCGNRWYSLLCIMFMAGFFLRIVLFFTGAANLEATLTITHIMMGISTIAGGFLLTREWRIYRDRTTLVFLIGFIALGLCLLISLLIFFMAPELNYAIYFRMMLTVLMLAMLYRILSQLEVMAKKGITAQIYHEMAYVDVLTGLSNRLAFEEKMQTLQENPGCLTLTVAVFDINRLKHVNDQYGHSAGDSLIQSGAHCIEDTFGQAGSCYRIGGDEFVVILKDFNETSLKVLIQHFREKTENAKPGNPEGLSISMGYATGQAQGENFAYDLFDKADQYMYVQKKKSHRQKTT